MKIDVILNEFTEAEQQEFNKLAAKVKNFRHNNSKKTSQQSVDNISKDIDAFDKKRGRSGAFGINMNAKDDQAIAALKDSLEKFKASQVNKIEAEKARQASPNTNTTATPTNKTQDVGATYDTKTAKPASTLSTQEEPNQTTGDVEVTDTEQSTANMIDALGNKVAANLNKQSVNDLQEILRAALEKATGIVGKVSRFAAPLGNMAKKAAKVLKSTGSDDNQNESIQIVKDALLEYSASQNKLKAQKNEQEEMMHSIVRELAGKSDEETKKNLTDFLAYLGSSKFKSLYKSKSGERKRNNVTNTGMMQSLGAQASDGIVGKIQQSKYYTGEKGSNNKYNSDVFSGSQSYEKGIKPKDVDVLRAVKYILSSDDENIKKKVRAKVGEVSREYQQKDISKQ